MLLGFVLVVLVFAMVTGFVLYEVDGLGSLQKDMARRTHDSLDIDEIALHAEEIYAVIADAVINRNVTETKEEFAKVKAQAEKDIKTVHSLVDHPEEVAMANEYETAMRQYMGLFESQLFPIVEKGASIEARMRDSLAIGAISLRLEQVYAVMADAMINRDLEATKKEWAVIKEQAEKDIAEVGKLVDTDAERAKAAEFGTHYRKYLELFETKTLPILAKGESVEGRMRDSLAIGGISLRLEQVYAVMADAVINRDLAATEKNWLEIKQAAFEDLSKVDQLVDTDAERKLAGDFAESYQEYLNIFENQLLPFLKGDEADNWAAIRDYDEKIDQARDKALQALSAINKSLEGETMEVIQDEGNIRKLDSEIDGVRGQALSALAGINKSLEGETEGAGQVASASGQVSGGQPATGRGLVQQAASIEETSSSLEEMSSMTRQNADNAGQADSLMKAEANQVVGEPGQRGHGEIDRVHGRDFQGQRRDLQDHQDHRRDRLPDQPAGPERGGGGGPGRRGRGRFRGGGRRGAQPGHARGRGGQGDELMALVQGRSRRTGQGRAAQLEDKSNPIPLLERASKDGAPRKAVRDTADPEGDFADF
jgi:methyl-accepting chemotaxis protein